MYNKFVYASENLSVFDQKMSDVWIWESKNE
jgi:hypothetical protein